MCGHLVSIRREKTSLLQDARPELSRAIVLWFQIVCLLPSTRIVVHSVVTVAVNRAFVAGRIVRLSTLSRVPPSGACIGCSCAPATQHAKPKTNPETQASLFIAPPDDKNILPRNVTSQRQCPTISQLCLCQPHILSLILYMIATSSHPRFALHMHEAPFPPMNLSLRLQSADR